MLKNNKTMNTMNNKMKGNDNMKNNNMNRAQQKVNDGTVSLSVLQNMKDIDMSQCKNPISVMHKIYNPISKVGLVTNVCTALYTVDVKTEKGFQAFKDALALLEEKEAEKSGLFKGTKTVLPYQSIWMEGYNKFTEFNFTTGQHYVYYNVTNVEMQMLKDNITALDKDSLTVEDALAIQADLPAIIRAWQESSIDVSKDKSKVFKYDYEEFFNPIKGLMSQSMNPEAINFGFDKLMFAKRSEAEVPNFKFRVGEEGLEQFIPDSIGMTCNKAFIEATEEYLNEEMKEIYALSDNDILNQFEDYAKANPEFAYIIKQLTKVVNNSFDKDIKIDKEILKDMRNYAYTKAEEMNIDVKDVIKIAISASMSKIYMKKDNTISIETDKNNYKSGAIKNIFPQEYIEAFAGKQTIELTIVDCDDIEDGQRIEFENGYSKEEGLCELEEDFTGIAYEKDGKLVYDINAYEYERCNAFVVDKTYKQGTTAQDIKADSTNTVEQAIDKTGEYAISKLQPNKEVKITGARGHIIKVDDEFIGRIYGIAELKGNYEIKYTTAFKAQNGQQQLAFVVLQ